MPVLPYRNIRPRIDPSVFIAPDALVIGDVEIGPESSIWFGCVLRGDMHAIRIGARTNIQDGSVIHVTAGGQGTHIGDGVTVGHMALLHDCTVENGGFVGMKATLMDGAKMETKAVLGAGALLTPGKTVPSGQLWAGSPAKFMREITPAEMVEFGARAQEYVDLSRSYL